MTKEPIRTVIESAPDANVTHLASETASATSGILHSEYTWITLAFVITIALVVRYLVPMINKGLDGRAEKIRDQLEQANRLRVEAEALLASYKAEQEMMLKQAEQTLADAKRDAAAMRTQAAAELKQALERRSQQAHEKIARAEADAIASIRTRIIDAATDSARRILTEQATGFADEQAITRAISAIEQQIH